ncbi:MAG: hypothetical protein JWM90_1994 [Thermoleophilia bacterium]|nr:hypothetical protein [Thermoleophilia bacterium]
MSSIQPYAAQLPQMYAPQYAMPNMNMGVPQYGAAGMQPVYINSMSQLPPGAIPVSQGMLGQALGQTGAAAVQPPNKAGTILGTVLKHAAIGGAAGAAIGLIPRLPPTMFMGALLGAGVGAAIGVVKGIKKANAQEQEYAAMQAQGAQGQLPQVGAAPAGAAAPVATPAAAAKAKHPGAKTFKDGAGNIRQIGTGTIVKPAKGAGAGVAKTPVTKAPVAKPAAATTPMPVAGSSAPLTAAPVTASPLTAAPTSAQAAAQTFAGANAAPVATSAPSEMGGIGFVDPSTQAPVMIK